MFESRWGLQMSPRLIRRAHTRNYIPFGANWNETQFIISRPCYATFKAARNALVPFANCCRPLLFLFFFKFEPRVFRGGDSCDLATKWKILKEIEETFVILDSKIITHPCDFSRWRRLNRGAQWRQVVYKRNRFHVDSFPQKGYRIGIIVVVVLAGRS